jgi:hypothetical protein
MRPGPFGVLVEKILQTGLDAFLQGEYLTASLLPISIYHLLAIRDPPG